MSKMAGVFKEEELGVGQVMTKVMVDGHGAVLKFCDPDGIRITVYLDPAELDKVIEERNRYLVTRAKRR